MKNLKTLLLAVIATTFMFQSCSDDDSTPNSNDKTNQYVDGIFVLNEGAMGNNNAEITFFKNGNAIQNIFRQSNANKNLGNIAQSIHFDDENVYVVVNGSNKIEVLENKSLISKATITSNLTNPRYAVTDEDYIYVTNWGDPSNPSDDYVSVYKISDYSFVNKIPVTEGPEQILIEDNQLIIAHAGGWSNGNSISIYNTSTRALKNIVVGDVPSAIIEDNNQLIVLCSGITWGDTVSAGKIVKISLLNQQISETINFEAGNNPRFLVKDDNNKLYYTLNNNIYQTTIQATTLPQTPLFTSEASYIYSFNVVNNAIYIGDAKDFASNGEVKYFSKTGNYLGEFSTGIGPNFITFH